MTPSVVAESDTNPSDASVSQQSFPSFSQVSCHPNDIVSQATALQKEYSCDQSDAFPVQLSTTMHSLISYN